MDAANAILAGERLLARRIALCIHVTRPRPVWVQAIPGMFLVEFLARTRFIRTYRAAYLRPRLPALAEAQGGAAATADLSAADRALHELLVEHYRRLLSAGGRGHGAAIRQAYEGRAAYTEFLERLDRAEAAADRAALDRVGADAAVRDRVRAEREQVRFQRDRHARETFLD